MRVDGLVFPPPINSGYWLVLDESTGTTPSPSPRPVKVGPNTCLLLFPLPPELGPKEDVEEPPVVVPVVVEDIAPCAGTEVVDAVVLG